MDRGMATRLAGDGHRVHRERNSYTHKAFEKQLNPEIEIRQNGKRVWGRYIGRYVKVCDLFPERVALAVDNDGNVVDDHTFRDNYLIYLDGFGMVHCNTQNEPIPDVMDYLLVWPDPAFPESDGRTVELGFHAEAKVIPEPLPTDAAEALQSATPIAGPDHASAPCGKVVKAAGVALHITKCQMPECTAAREARKAS